MAENVRLFLFPAIVVTAWLVSRHRDELARKCARLAAAIVAILLVCIAISGWIQPRELAMATHRWTGHLLVVAVWLFVPFAIGVSLQQHLKHRPVTAIVHMIAVLALLGATLLASFTGYLGPAHVDPLFEETNTRFQVLHLVGLPAIVAILIACSFWYFRRSKTYVAEQTHAPEPPIRQV
jgi:cytochrome bd-type quinol oxidase subunit 2